MAFNCGGGGTTQDAALLMHSPIMAAMMKNNTIHHHQDYDDDDGAEEIVDNRDDTTKTSKSRTTSSRRRSTSIGRSTTEHSHFGDGYSVRTRHSLPGSTGAGSIPVVNDGGGGGTNYDPNTMLEADYDTGATELYRNIENKNWDDAMERSRKMPQEASIWVSRKDNTQNNSNSNIKNEKVRWRLLPLHAVCIFRAPLALIEALIDAYPDGPQMKDDQGMLPVHLACRNGASKGVVLTLLHAFPASVMIHDRKNRYLSDLVNASNSINKDTVLQGIQEFHLDYENDLFTPLDGDDIATNNIANHANENGSSTSDPSATMSTSNSKKAKQKLSTSTTMKSSSNRSTAANISVNNNNNTSSARSSVNSSGSNHKSSTKHSISNSHSDHSPNNDGNSISNKSRSSSKSKTSVSSQKQSQSMMDHNNCPDANSNYNNGSTGIELSNSTMVRSVLSINHNNVVEEEYEVDYDNRTVLFRLILKKDWDAVMERCTDYPKEVATWIVTKGFNGSLRFLPIHKACVLQPPADVIHALLQSYPLGAKKTDQDGWLPIHCAAFYSASCHVMEELILQNPKALQWKDDDGRLPIHYACLKGADSSTVTALVTSYQRSTMIKDDEGRLALHHACSKGASSDVIDILIKSNPKGAQTKDEQGRLPLHHACRKNATERTIRTLLKVYPRAAQIKDDQDKLPIHYACQSSSCTSTTNANNNVPNKDVVHCLIQAYPESIHIENGFGQTPIQEVTTMIQKLNASSSGNTPPPTTSYKNSVLESWNELLSMLQQFQSDHDTRILTSGSTTLEARISIMERRIQAIEKCLSNDFYNAGKEIKLAAIKGKDPNIILDKLAQHFMDIVIGNNAAVITSSKKERTTTPIKNLFGRNKK